MVSAALWVADFLAVDFYASLVDQSANLRCDFSLNTSDKRSERGTDGCYETPTDIADEGRQIGVLQIALAKTGVPLIECFLGGIREW